MEHSREPATRRVARRFRQRTARAAPGAARRGLAALSALVISFAGRSASAEAPDTSSLPTALSFRVGTNAAASFGGWNTMIHGVAVGATYAMSQGGADAAANRWAQGHPRGLSVGWSAPAVIGGIAAPVVLPLALWFAGEPGSNHRVAAAAAGQAAILGLATSAVLKAFTGRVSPEAAEPADLAARSRTFRFGLLRGGIIEGWPSGHTMTNVAMATALIASSDSWAVRAGAGAFAAWVALAVSFGINGEVHWASDAVAGLLSGAAIGWTVGRSFRQASPPAAALSPGSSVRVLSVFPVFSGVF